MPLLASPQSFLLPARPQLKYSCDATGTLGCGFPLSTASQVKVPWAHPGQQQLNDHQPTRTCCGQARAVGRQGRTEQRAMWRVLRKQAGHLACTTTHAMHKAQKSEDLQVAYPCGHPVVLGQGGHCPNLAALAAQPRQLFLPAHMYLHFLPPACHPHPTTAAPSHPPTHQWPHPQSAPRHPPQQLPSTGRGWCRRRCCCCMVGGSRRAAAPPPAGAAGSCQLAHPADRKAEHRRTSRGGSCVAEAAIDDSKAP